MIKEFNSLKGVLAVMIFVHHCPLEFEWKPAFGIIAVAIFFMLSGFLSAIGYKDKVLSPSFSYRQYIKVKSTKFYPLHFLFLIAAVPLSILNVTSWISYLATFVLNASLLHSIVPIKTVYFSFNLVSWFLSDTLIFVALFPFIMRWMLNAKIKTKVIAGLSAISFYVVAWGLIPDDYTHQFFYISPLFRLLDFVLGIQCGLWFMDLKEQGKLKTFIVRYSTSLHWLSIVLLVGLTYMATFDVNTCLHSVIYMPIIGMLLILIGLNRGGYQALSFKNSDPSVSPSFWHIKSY